VCVVFVLCEIHIPGFSNTLYFERRENIWQLIRFEDLSD
jgi:hypothetical protein